MKYCRRCVTPDTRPNIALDEQGVCNACRSRDARADIDWAARERAFERVVEHAKSRSAGYDCLIPVSGGKDSTWQLVTCLEYGLNPLAVTWKTPARTAIGDENLANLVSLGVDHIDYQVNPKVERKFMYQALVRYGSTALPMHMALFGMTLNMAARFEIPLIVWGENSAVEYGAADEQDKGFKLDARWLKTYGVTHGTAAKDWVSDELSERELTPYFGPTSEQLEKKGVLAVFLGFYFPWDPAESLRVARRHGFRAREAGPRTGYWNYADIDDDFIAIHHYLKWYKFGFTRLFDNLSVEIRHGRMEREEAVEIIRVTGDQTPLADIEACCAFMGVSTNRFFEVAETFRNTDVWNKEHGVWMIEDFLVSDWRWS